MSEYAGVRIGIDARVIPRYPGLGRHCLNILRQLCKLDKKNEYVVFALDQSLSFLEEYANFRVVYLDFQVLSLGTLFSFYRYVKKEQIDLFYSPFQITPPWLPCPRVVTVHDMMDLMYPDAFSYHPLPVRLGLNAYFRFNVPRSVKKASMLMAVSRETKKNMLEYFNLPEDSVKVVYNGVGEEFRRIEEENILARVRKKYQLPQRFILYLGSIKPYKNLNGTLKTYLKLLEKWPRMSSIKLVIAGLKHFSIKSVEAIMKDPAVEGTIQRIGHVEDKDLPALYSLAELFLFPSIWEGFGQPPLEAMACGVPVVSSNRTSLPEVVGDAGILADPEDIDQMAHEVYRVLTDLELREQMIQRGFRQAAKFRWDTAAKETLSVLQTVIDKEIKHAN